MAIGAALQRLQGRQARQVDQPGRRHQAQLHRRQQGLAASQQAAVDAVLQQGHGMAGAFGADEINLGHGQPAGLPAASAASTWQIASTMPW